VLYVVEGFLSIASSSPHGRGIGVSKELYTT
jgi:hypothetical protein